MTHEQAKKIINESEPSFLAFGKTIGGKHTYVCPVCGNGSGKDRTGIIKDPKSGRWHCFKCGLHEDVIGLYHKTAPLMSIRDVFITLYGFYNITIDHIKERNAASPDQSADVKSGEIVPDYHSFLLTAEKNVNYEYLLSRGISESVQKYFHVGQSESGHLVVPFGDGCGYLERAVDTKFYRNTGTVALTPVQSLYNINSDVLFVVEGVIDAMSVFEVGGQAVALNGTSHYQLLIDAIESGDFNKAIVLMMDHDLNQAGRICQEKLARTLQQLEVPFLEVHLESYGEHDPNEFLMHNRQQFAEVVTSFTAQAKKLIYRDTINDPYHVSGLLDHFRYMENEPDTLEIPTGFTEFDRQLDGGFHEGLYLIGAVSSLGKTTFVLQLADQIAASGTDVLFFSLEMSRYELMAKSISRYTYTRNKENHAVLSRTTNEIYNKRFYSSYSVNQRNAINKAIEEYEVAAKHLYIYDGRYKGEPITASAIWDIVAGHVKTTGNVPMIIIDYLQILEAPSKKRMDDKQKTDFNVHALKEISRDYHATVLAISSFNRESYNKPVSKSSFKESGGVEYSSDVLLGLQYTGMETVTKEADVRRLDEKVHEQKKARTPISVDLLVLKDRNNYNETIRLKMIPAYNYFEESHESLTMSKNTSKSGKVY